MGVLLKGESRRDSDWRSRAKVLGVKVTDAMSLFDHLQIEPEERQTEIDSLVIKDLVENSVRNVHCARLLRMPNKKGTDNT